MELKYKIFPYPVLADYLDDYVNVKFSVNVTLNHIGSKIKIDSKYELDDQQLNELIDQGKAEVINHYECPATAFRTVQVLTRGNNEYSISDAMINGKLQVCSFIIAKTEIANYSNVNFHSDYRGLKFTFDPGNIIAVGGETDFDVIKSRDELVNTESIFSIVKNMDESSEEFIVEFDGKDKIIVTVPFEVYSLYKNLSLKYRNRELLNSMVIVSTLTYILEEIGKVDMETRYEEFSDLRWYKSLKKILLESYGVDIESQQFSDLNKLEYAQKLLNSPLINAFKTLEDTYDEMGDEDR